MLTSSSHCWARNRGIIPDSSFCLMPDTQFIGKSCFYPQNDPESDQFSSPPLPPPRFQLPSWLAWTGVIASFLESWPHPDPTESVVHTAAEGVLLNRSHSSPCLPPEASHSLHFPLSKMESSPCGLSLTHSPPFPFLLSSPSTGCWLTEHQPHQPPCSHGTL